MHPKRLIAVADGFNPALIEGKASPFWQPRDTGRLVLPLPEGGTATGVGRYLKERNPRIKVWGIDTYGSVFKKYKETGIFDKNEIYPYITEGIGEDFLPQNVDFNIIDHFEKVTDKDAAVPVVNVRTQQRGVAYGTAQARGMELRFMAGNADVQVGDTLQTSGLDGVYPAGLPVAKVSQVDRRADSAFARIALAPLSSPDSTRHVLLLQPASSQMPERPADAASGAASVPEDKGRHGKGVHHGAAKPAATSGARP